MAARALLLVAAPILLLLTLVAALDGRRIDARVASPALASPLGSAPSGATPDLGAPLPAGVTLALLGGGAVDATAAGPATIRLERLTLPAGAPVEAKPLPGPQLLVVETGALVLAGIPELAGRYGAGGQALVPADRAYALRNESDQPARLLRLRLVPDPLPAAPAAASPVLASPIAGGASADVLLAAVVRVPRGPASLVLARVTWEPGADVGTRIYPGPVGLVVESGTLIVAGPTGEPLRLGAGGSMVAPAYTAHQARNGGPEPVSALAVAILPAAPPRAAGRLPTSTPDLGATAEAEAEAARATIAALATGEAARAAEASAASVAVAASEARANAVAATLEANAATQASVAVTATGSARDAAASITAQ